jgi:DNA primase
MKLEVNRAFKRRIAREKKKQEKLDLAPSRSHQPSYRSIRYDNMKSARAEESVLAQCMRQSALLDQTKALKPEMFSVDLFGRVFDQITRRHNAGLEVSLSGLTDFTPEEMSHVAGILHTQQGPVSERALADCVQTILREHQSSRVETEDDIMALRERMKQSKGIKA